jgi:murein DD-endopeptidase MepM/ murein hydrolase activator NlpD
MLLLAAILSQAASAIDITVSARSLAPGELAVLALKLNEDAGTVIVSAFGKKWPAYKLRPGEWQALVGIDLDQAPGAYVLTAEAHAGAAVTRGRKSIQVKPRAFPTRTLRVDPEFVNPPEAVLARIASEAAFIAGAIRNSAQERLWSAPFVRPVDDPANSRFGTRSVYNGEKRRPHGGADFLSPAGKPVRAPNAGRVVAARDMFFTGNTVIIDHGLGVVSLLAHLSAMDVREGEDVAAGQVVGRVGATGRVTGAHLHWGITVSGARVDPLSVLALVGGGH